MELAVQLLANWLGPKNHRDGQRKMAQFRASFFKKIKENKENEFNVKILAQKSKVKRNGHGAVQGNLKILSPLLVPVLWR